MKNNTTETKQQPKAAAPKARRGPASYVRTVMKPLISLTAALLFTGCASLPRSGLPPAEARYHWTVRHSQPASAAFAKVELALAQTYNNLPQVMVLRQAESGTFILHPLVSYSVLGYVKHARYSLKVVVGETITMEFELGAEVQYGACPPSSAMPGIKTDFMEIATRVAQAVGGTLE
jgi:hypothetical protein